MKKILALLIALSLFFSTAAAEVKTPVPPPTQHSLQQSFLMNVLQFVLGTNLDVSGINLNITEEGQQLFNALVQMTDSITDFDFDINGMPARLQLSDEALLVSFADQIYTLPYENIMQIVSAFSGGETGVEGVEPVITPDVAENIMSTVWETVIIPSFSFEETDDAIHLILNVTEERVIALGDALFGDARVLAMLSTMTGETDLAETWTEVRSMLESGQLPVSIQTDIEMSNDDLTGTANASILGMTASANISAVMDIVKYDVSVDGLMTMTGRQNLSTGEFAYHSEGPHGFSYDVKYTPDGDSWTFAVNETAEGLAIQMDAVSTPAAFDASLLFNMEGIEETTKAEAHFDKETGILEGHAQLPGEIQADLSGEPATDGYKVLLDVASGETPLATVEGIYTETEKLMALEVDVRSAEMSIVSGDFAVAKATQAYALHGKTIYGYYLNAEGIFTDNRKTCNVEIGENGKPEATLALSLIKDGYEYSLSCIAEGNVRNSGVLSRLFEFYGEVDTSTGAFNASYRNPMGRTYADAQGIFTNSLIKLRLDVTGRNPVRLDVTCVQEFEYFTGNWSLSCYGMSTTGNILWTPYVKSIDTSMPPYLRKLSVTLNQNKSGMPTKLQVLSNYAVAGTKQSFVELYARDDEVLIRNNGMISVARGGFKDGKTYVLELITNEGMYNRENRTTVTLTVEHNKIVLAAVDNDGNTVFNTTLSKVDKTGFEPLFDRQDAIEITPEFIMELLQSLNSGPAPEMANAEVSEGAAADSVN